MIYEYQCPSDGTKVEVERKMTDPEEQYSCSTCGGILQRIWHSVPVSFNGSGFYSTDNKK